MRVAVIAESSLIQMNGVTNSVRHVLRHLEANGHEARVFAPRGDAGESDADVHGAGVALLRSVPLPSYPEVRVTFARAARLESMLREYAPDVVHLAAPFVLGWQALRAADHLGIPTVAIYQTDVAGYAQRYGIPAATTAIAQHIARIHRRATLTLAPSSSAIAELTGAGVDRLRLWARGVDAERFHPSRRDPEWRRAIAPDGEVVVGYVGRLAPEKQIEDLRAIADLPGTRLVIVGDGPSRPALEKLLPDAVFLGFLNGLPLAEALASFDVFVHPGENETFCQTVQEALASGVPIVATGRGGPVDLVQNSRTGWLYRPGDLDDLRARVRDLTGDTAKRQAFARAARESVAHRTWASLGDELIGHYRDAVAMRRAGVAGPTGPVRILTQGVAPSMPPVATPTRPEGPPQWRRYVAIGDSMTEGLCDTSRQADGTYRGWADRLAMLLGHAGPTRHPLRYANLAVRSRTISDVLQRQIPRALELRADLVTVLIGGNDVARRGADPARLASELRGGIERLRASGADVLIVTPFCPPWPLLRALHERTTELSRHLRGVAAETGSLLLDFSRDVDRLDERMWAGDRVHLSSHGHRVLSYRAAAVLGVPGASELGALDHAIHLEPPVDTPTLSNAAWMWTHVRPWLGRRLRGVTAGDGLPPKHDELVVVRPVTFVTRHS